MLQLFMKKCFEIIIDEILKRYSSFDEYFEKEYAIDKK